MSSENKKLLSAFTLIECMISLAIFTIVIAFSFTNIMFLQDSFVHNEIDKLYMVAHYLQDKARLTCQEQVLTFDTFARKYSFNGRVETLPECIEFGILPGVKGPPSNPLHPIVSPITFKGEKITFYPQGIMQSGTIYIMNKQRGCLYALSCGVSQVSFLRKYRYDKRWVLLS